MSKFKDYRRGPPSTLTTHIILLYLSMNNALSLGIDIPFQSSYNYTETTTIFHITTFVHLSLRFPNHTQIHHLHH
ncbi:hypothetical protein VIGAN_11183000, partial [Vigna angularis var. angularis]